MLFIFYLKELLKKLYFPTSTPRNSTSLETVDGGENFCGFVLKRGAAVWVDLKQQAVLPISF
jgi:hypothetical protein